jgi:hypothetical protein
MSKKRVRPQPRLRERSSDVEEDPVEEGEEKLPHVLSFHTHFVHPLTSVFPAV